MTRIRSDSQQASSSHGVEAMQAMQLSLPQASQFNLQMIYRSFVTQFEARLQNVVTLQSGL
jgi:predicted component of type VI protein secretion system